MAKVQLPFFGMIDPEATEDYYESDCTISDVEVMLDINIDDPPVADKDLKMVAEFLEQREALIIKAIEAIKENAADDEDEPVPMFIDLHLSELEPDQLTKMYGTKEPDVTTFLSGLRLQRIGFYPDEEDDMFAVLDISLPDEITNYLIAVTFDRNFNISDISLES